MSVDFNKKIINSDKFREPAITFQKYGRYTTAPRGTSGYLEYWDEQYRRSVLGYTAPDGDWISGYHYFYLNFCPIMLVKQKSIKLKNGNQVTRNSRVKDFPRFYDYDYYYFQAIEQAEQQGKHMVVVKKRGAGYSFKGGSMLARNFFLFPGSKSYAIASEREFLIKDGLLTKAWEFIDFINENTAWAKKMQKKNTDMHKRASYIAKDPETGAEIEAGTKSEIMGVSLNKDVQKARGKRGKLILWEEAGKFPGLLQAWQIAQPSVEESGHAFGLMIAYGTGGTEGGDYEGLKELFYATDAYNVLGFDNIWETGDARKCGFFVPEYSNMTGDYNGSSFMDKDGNSNKDASIDYTIKEREKVEASANDKRAIDRYIAEHPITPSEATLQLSGNIFPKKDLIDHMNNIMRSTHLSNYGQEGRLAFDETGTLKWISDGTDHAINKYPLDRNDKKHGAITIWEHPIENPPHGLYIGGCLTPGEKVLTEIGLKNVEDVNITDRLINKDGELVRINALLAYNKIDEPTYKVKMSNIYRTTNFTQEHPLYISNSAYNTNKTINEDKFDFSFTRMRNVKKGMWVKYPNIYRKSKKYKLPFNISDEDYFWWFIGLWLGDGWISKNRVCIAFNAKEQEYINHLLLFIHDILGLNSYVRARKNNCIEISFSHAEIVKFLVTNFNKGAANKILPEWVKYIPYDYKCNLIQGYLNSDGCITKNNKYYSTEFVSVSLELLEGFQDILFSLGIVSNMSLLRSTTISYINSRQVIQLPTWHLRLSHHSTLSLVDKLPFTDDPKIKRIDFNNLPKVRTRPKDGCFISKDLDYIYLQIKEIKQDKYTGIVYNFDCETHTFICPYITTHNCDPYDHDEAGTSPSLGSVFIYKRFQSFEQYYDLPVAEYTGRPDTAEDFYETTRRLAIYYNARILYENEKRGMFPYFVAKHCDYLLADQPDIIGDIVKNSTVNRKKGIHMSKSIKDWMERELRDWLNEEYAPGKKNLTKIMSIPLLQELISYNPDGNFDRVISYGLCMVYKAELHNVHITDARKQEKKSKFFEKPLFGNLTPKIL